MKTIYSFLFTLILILSTSNHAIALIINIPDDHETIQAGIDASEDGDTVLVQPGEYPEAIVMPDQNLTLASLYIINGDEEAILETIIFGDEQQENGIKILDANDIQINITGLSIENWGTGIRISRSDVIYLNNLNINSNVGYDPGIFCDESELVINNCRVWGNTTQWDAGGINIINSDVKISDCDFHDNSAQNNGGAILIRGDSRVVIASTQFYRNTGERFGGVISNMGGDLLITNCTFANNTSNQASGTLDLIGDNNSVVNSIITGEDNLIYQRGGDVAISYSNINEDQIYQEGGEVNWGEGNIDENPLFTNPDDNDFELTTDSPCIDSGDPEADLDPDGTRADMGAYYFHQLDIDVNPINIEFPAIEWGAWDSVAVNIINTGGTDLSILEILIPLYAAHVFLQDVDPDDLPIVIQPEDTLTLYAYNHPDPRVRSQNSYIIVSDDPDEPEIEITMRADVLSVSDETDMPFRFDLTSIYPNPFNSTVSISYNVPQVTDVSIQIYDLSGRLIESLVNRQLPAGRHSVIWAADNYAAGMYLIRMEAQNFRQIRKVILTR